MKWIIIMPGWVKFLFSDFVSAVALWPFVLIRHPGMKWDRSLIRHESIHLRQQIELLVLPFYVWYVLEYLIRWIQYRDRKQAYHNISFEREAYAHEKDKDYLVKRKLWSFLRYL